jgi:hypothetical protein
MALQLDPIDQIDRDGNALFAQGIEERLLQRLSFRHDITPALLLWSPAFEVGRYRMLKK